jgi:hypothetical protein
VIRLHRRFTCSRSRVACLIESFTHLLPELLAMDNKLLGILILYIYIYMCVCVCVCVTNAARGIITFTISSLQIHVTFTTSITKY